MRRFPLPVRLAVGCAVLGGVGRLAAAPTWLKVETPDVQVYSDVSRRDLIEFAVRYSAFRHVFNELLAPEGRRPPPSTILLFRQVESLRSYVAGFHPQIEHLTSFTTKVDSRALLALALEGDRDQALTTAFEFDTTWMLQRVGYLLPIWMSQGTGEVLSSLRIRRGNCIVGDPQERLTVPFDQQPAIPWERFFRLGTSSPEYTGKDNFTGIYQSQAWALMHLVLLGGDGFRARFQRLVKVEQIAQETGMTGSDLNAVAALVGTQPKRLTDAVWSSRQSGKTIQVAFDENAVRAKLTVVPAPEAEIRVQLSDLYAGAGNNLDAEVQFNRALELAPNSLIVKEAQARVELRRGQPELAVQSYREAIAAGSTDAQAYLTSANQRLDDNRSGGRDLAGSGGADIAQAIAEIHRSLELAPGNGEAYRLLGRAYFVAPVVKAENAAELTPALADPDAGPAIRLYRALLFQRLGRSLEFAADLRSLADDPWAPPTLRRDALEQLRRAQFADDQQKVQQLAGQKQYAEARAVIAAALVQDGGAADPREYRRLQGWLDDDEAQAKLLDLYHARQWPDLREAAAAYLAARPGGGFATGARQLQAAAERELQPSPAAAVPVPVTSAEPVGPSIGIRFSDRQWSRYRPYSLQLLRQIRAAWKQPGDRGLLPAAGTKISVTMIATSDGNVESIEQVDSPPGTSPALTAACTAAINDAAPYRPWTDEMADDLGKEQTLIITFAF